MAHYAFLDKNNIVTEVITGKNENEDGINWEIHYGNFRGQVCKRTSYNTFANVHNLGGTPFRKNYASVGYTYREDLDAFIPPQPFPSWILDENTGQWEPPVPSPVGGSWEWDEQSVSWVAVPIVGE